jgi:hypothetical protein
MRSKQRFRLFRRQRGGCFIIEDTEAGRQESTGTRDPAEAERLLHARRESVRTPQINLQIARAYLVASDPAFATRTWQDVLGWVTASKEGANKDLWERAAKCHDFDRLRVLPVINTTAEHLLAFQQQVKVSPLVFLRRLVNFALGAKWLPAPVLRNDQWKQPPFPPKTGHHCGGTSADHRAGNELGETRFL